MVYADRLRSEGYDYMAYAVKAENLKKEKRTPLLHWGGLFHMRRRDYLYADPGYIPSIKAAANYR